MMMLVDIYMRCNVANFGEQRKLPSRSVYSVNANPNPEKNHV